MNTACASPREAASHTLVQPLADDPFALDIAVVDEPLPNRAEMACDTNDGCKSTCASSCASASA